MMLQNASFVGWESFYAEEALTRTEAFVILLSFHSSLFILVVLVLGGGTRYRVIFHRTES